MNAIKTLLMALVMLCGTPAFADSYCADGKGGTFLQLGSRPCPPVSFTGRIVRAPAPAYNEGYDDGQYRRQPVAVRQQAQSQLPPGYARIPCDFWEKLKKEFVVNGLNALKGGLVGAGLGDDSRSAGIGAALGLFFGPSAGPCYVIVPPEHKEAVIKQASEFSGRPIPAEEQVGGTEGAHDEVETVTQNRPIQRPRTNNVCNVCADQPGRIPVYRKNGELVCRLQSRPPEEGERPACRSAS